MSKKVATVNYISDVGFVRKRNAGAWDFIYEVTKNKSERWNVGDRVVLPDGREFRYAKSAGICHAAHGCEITATGYTAIATFAVAAAIGAREVIVPAGTHATLTEDELVGGYIILFDGADDSNTTVRGILGNDAAASAAAFKVYLDAPLTCAITAGTSKAETYQNPWAALTDGSNAALAKAGIPAAYVSAANMYFWVQTKGITWAAPQAGLGGGANGLNGGFWRHDGSIDDAGTSLGVTVPAASTSQYAGYVIEGSQAGNGPLFMLQG